MHVVTKHSGTLVDEFDDLLERYERNEFASPYRSTVPLLSYWRDAEARSVELADALGFHLGQSLNLHFEFEVPVQRGSGFPSCTDLMLCSGDVSVAIEAKRTEPRYETVETWLSKAKDANRSEVLEGWLGLLRTGEATCPQMADVADLPYQIIHRAASACFPSSKVKWLVYQVFGDSEEELKIYEADLRALRAVLPESHHLSMGVALSLARPTALQRELEMKWDAGERDLHHPVMLGLSGNDLFEFGFTKVIAV